LPQKLAIFDEKEQAALLGACESDSEFIPLWLMMRCGLHPCDISRSKEKFSFDGDFLMWKRAKNAKPRREHIPPDIRPRLERWLRHGRKLSRVGYYQLVRRVGARIGHPEWTPMTLRHTFCLQELRRYSSMRPPPPDFISLVARRMGCTREVVIQNYLDLTQWESLGGKEGGEQR